MHIPFRLCLVLLIAAIASPARADGERRSARFLPAIEALTPLFSEVAARKDIPGVSVAVAFEDRLVWAQGFGYAELERKIPMDAQSTLRVGSVAKVMSAAALARLYERGEIDLEATARSLVPSWPEKRWPVTLRQLAGHQAGVRHYEGGEFLSNRAYPSVTEGLAIFKDDPLLFEPGSAASYSTYGWSLLSAAMEGASGQDFLTLMRREVFGPLGMENTMADKKGALVSNRAGVYGLNADGRLATAPEVDNSYKWASGGFLSTPGDVAHFALAHAQPGYLKAETLDLLFTQQALKDGSPSVYGLGWIVGFDFYLQRIASRLPPEAQEVGRRIMGAYPLAVMHSGGSVGGTTMLILSRKHRMAVVVVINSSDGQGFPLLLALHALDAFIQNAEAVGL